MAQPDTAVQLPDLSGINWPDIGKEMGLGAVLGFAVGYAAKKAMKLLLIVVALLVLLAVALETQGWITVNWSALETSYSQAVKPEALAYSFERFIAYIGRVLPATAGFALGCVLGFKRG